MRGDLPQAVSPCGDPGIPAEATGRSRPVDAKTSAALITVAAPVERILTYIGEPPRPPRSRPRANRPAGTMISGRYLTKTFSDSPSPKRSSISASPGSRHLLPQRVPLPLISRLPAAPAISSQTLPKRAPTPSRCPRRSRLSLDQPLPSLASHRDATSGLAGAVEFPIRRSVSRNTPWRPSNSPRSQEPLLAVLSPPL